MKLAEQIIDLLEWAKDAHGNIKQVHSFASASKPGKVYKTVEYSDGSMSCNCPGWTHARGGERLCKHIKKLGGKSVGA